MLKSRTDLPAITIIEPLSPESIRQMFDDIREDLGMPRRKPRDDQRKALESSGFPFATDEDMSRI